MLSWLFSRAAGSGKSELNSPVPWRGMSRSVCAHSPSRASIQGTAARKLGSRSATAELPVRNLQGGGTTATVSSEPSRLYCSRPSASALRLHCVTAAICTQRQQAAVASGGLVGQLSFLGLHVPLLANPDVLLSLQVCRATHDNSDSVGSSCRAESRGQHSGLK